MQRICFRLTLACAFALLAMTAIFTGKIPQLHEGASTPASGSERRAFPLDAQRVGNIENDEKREDLPEGHSPPDSNGQETQIPAAIIGSPGAPTQESRRLISFDTPEIQLSRSRQSADTVSQLLDFMAMQEEIEINGISEARCDESGCMIQVAILDPDDRRRLVIALSSDFSLSNRRITRVDSRTPDSEGLMEIYITTDPGLGE